jgi:hypothetical protein
VAGCGNGAHTGEHEDVDLVRNTPEVQDDCSEALVE